MDELHHGYPEAYAAWLRFAALLPASATAELLRVLPGCGDYAGGDRPSLLNLQAPLCLCALIVAKL
jgi:hypothetical protein